MLKSVITDTVEGTGASININCGFIPTAVKLINIDGDAVLDWTADMGTAKGYKTLGTGLGALIATLGVTASVPGTSTFMGFTIGADTDVNVNGETLIWIAYR